MNGFCAGGNSERGGVVELCRLCSASHTLVFVTTALRRISSAEGFGLAEPRPPQNLARRPAGFGLSPPPSSSLLSLPTLPLSRSQSALSFSAVSPSSDSACYRPRIPCAGCLGLARIGGTLRHSHAQAARSFLPLLGQGLGLALGSPLALLEYAPARIASLGSMPGGPRPAWGLYPLSDPSDFLQRAP